MKRPSKRTLNVRFLIIVLVSTLVVAAGVHGLHIVQVSRNAKTLLAQANEAEAKKDLTEAIRRLEQYVNFERADADANRRLAMLLSSDDLVKDQSGRGRAIGALEKALALNADDRETRLKLTRLLLQQGIDPRFRGLWLEAKGHVETLARLIEESGGKGKVDGEVEALRGDLEAATNQEDKAIDAYRRSLAALPAQLDAYVNLAELLRKRKARVSRTTADSDQAEADGWMDAKEVKSGVIAANPKSAKARIARASYVERHLQDTKAARADILAALKLEPENTDALFTAARFAAIDGEIEVARAHLDRAIAIDPKGFAFYDFLAQLETSVGNIEKAVGLYEKATKAIDYTDGQGAYARFKWAEALIAAERFDRAVPLIAELREKGFKKPMLDMLDAQILVSKKEWARAAELVDQFAPLLDDPREKDEVRNMARQAYRLQAYAYGQLRNRDQQIGSLRRALNVGGGGADDAKLQVRELQGLIRVELARALSDAGKTEEAEAEYRRSVTLNTRSSGDSRIELIRFSLENVARQAPAQRRWGEVEALIDELAKAEPLNPAPAVFRAQMLVQQGKLAEAEAVLRDQIKATPKEPMLWSALMTVVERMNNGSEVLPTLDKAKAVLGNSVDLRQIEIRIFGNSSTAEGKARLASALADLDKLSPENQGRLYMTLGTTQARGGKLDDAYGSFVRWKKAEPLSIMPLLVLYDVAIMRKDKAAQKELVGEIRKLEGENGPNWKFVQARALLEQATTEEKDEKKKVELLSQAERLLAESVKIRPNWSRALMGLGQVQDLLNKTADAITHYTRSIQLGESDPAMIRRAVMLLFQNRRYNEANDLLKLAQEGNLLNEDLARMASGISLQTEDFERALTLATAAANSANASEADRVWLNQVLIINGQRAEANGKPAEAQELFKRAEGGLRKLLEASPANPEAWVLLVQNYVYSKQLSAATAAADEASKALKGAKDQARARQALATCLAAVGKSDEAVRIYREMLASNPKDPAALRALAQLLIRSNSRDEARKILDQLVALKEASPSDADWAYRTKAVLAASENGYQGTMAGIKLLEEAPARSVEDRRARARLLASIRNRESREKAAALLEELIKADPPLPDDLYLLAQIYEASGKWSRGKELYQKLSLSQAKNPAVISVYIRALIKNKELNEAQSWLDKLSQLAPQDITTQELRARLLAERGNKAGAAEILRTLGRRDPQNLAYAAGVLENLKIFDAAEELYRSLAGNPKPPTNALYLAAFLGRVGRTSEALDVAERSWGQVKPIVSSNLSVQILYASKGRDEDCERVARKILEALKANPNSSELLFDLANIRSLQARYSEAEEIYRDLWKSDSKNAVTINNLAWLLAMQENPKGAEALEAIASAIEILGPTPDLLDTRAVAHIVTASYPQAIKDLKDAIAIKPEPVMYIHLALAHLRNNAKGEARAALNEARINGFAPENLHPLERKSYQELVKALGSE